MTTTLHGIDIIRAYELSWLNNRGKPQLGILEFIVNPRETIDTLKLKKLLESLNNKKYNDITEVQNIIKDYVNCDLNIISENEFATFDFFEQINLPNIFQNSHGLRFICKDTNQPFIGTLNLVSNNPLSDHEIKITDDVLIKLRNLKFSPSKFVSEILSELKNINNYLVISVHLHRRGGISYQALRSTNDIDFSKFITRSIFE